MVKSQILGFGRFVSFLSAESDCFYPRVCLTDITFSSAVVLARLESTNVLRPTRELLLPAVVCVRGHLHRLLDRLDFRGHSNTKREPLFLSQDPDDIVSKTEAVGRL